MRREEALRKLIHVAFGGLAFAVPLLGAGGTALLALAALLFNAFLWPRLGGRRLWRAAERERGRSPGIVLYPLAVLLLALAFWRRLEVVAAAWGILAFGDGMAGLLGAARGRARLPWNPRKTWVGSGAFWLFGSAAATALLASTRAWAGAPVPWLFLAAAAAAAALFAAALESLPLGLDDNLLVPLPTGLVLFGLIAGEAYWTAAPPAAFWTGVAVGLGLNLALGFAAYLARAIDVSGWVAGTAAGTVIYAYLGWRGWLLLGAFFVLGTAATRLGYAEKASRRLAQEAGGRRSARHALANAGVAALAALFAATTPYAAAYVAAFAAALAAAASDTLESEIGQLRGRRTVLITTLAPVPPGTDGGVSLAGTVAGLAGAAAIAAAGWAVGLYAPLGMLVVAAAGFAGSLVDSVLGATLERRRLLDNEAVNFLCTLAAALLGGAAFVVLLGLAGALAWNGEPVAVRIRTDEIEARRLPVEVVAIPAGKFRMGSPDDEEGRWDHEGPVHEVHPRSGTGTSAFAVCLCLAASIDPRLLTLSRGAGSRAVELSSLRSPIPGGKGKRRHRWRETRRCWRIDDRAAHCLLTLVRRPSYERKGKERLRGRTETGPPAASVFDDCSVALPLPPTACKPTPG